LRVSRRRLSRGAVDRVPAAWHPFQNEVGLPIRYKGERLPLGYRVDFICLESVLVEIKALATVGPIDQAQVINYLRASQYERALLLNFGASSLQYRRLVWTMRR
jgi:GxxExxY protein